MFSATVLRPTVATADRWRRFLAGESAAAVNKSRMWRGLLCRVWLVFGCVVAVVVCAVLLCVLSVVLAVVFNPLQQPIVDEAYR